MSKYRSSARMERIDEHWQASDAVICGEVEIGKECSFWFGVVVRGDVAPIRIGARVNVQEHCALHCDSGKPLEIGDDVTIGHGARSSRIESGAWVFDRDGSGVVG